MTPSSSQPHQRSASPRLPCIGDILTSRGAGKLELVAILGEGGMASVFEAKNIASGERVAVKVLTPELARDPQLVARFSREAKAVSGLLTRHVAHVIDVSETESGVPFIVMELLEGRDLEVELAARGVLPLGEVVDYVVQACSAMIEAHANGIVHRDLKPANLYVTNGTERLVKVLDFGISKVVGEATRLTGAGTVMGTVLYMPPEQIRASTSLDLRADIWALGVIVFELLAGRAPWEGAAHKVAAEIVSSDAPDIRTFIPVPEGIASFLKKALQRDPDARFQNMTEVVQVLGPYAAPGSIGRAIADEIAAMETSARSRGGTRRIEPGSLPPQPLPRQQKTVPLATLPAPPPISRRSALPPITPAAQAPQRSAFALGFALVFVAAFALAVVAFFVHRAKRRATVPTSAPVVLVEPSTLASVAPRPSSIEPVSSSARSLPPPPPTGTTRAPPTSATSHSPPRHSATATPANPTHL